MPAFANQTRLINDQAQLDEFCDQLTGQPVISLDTEFVRTETYYPQLCLIQIAIDSHIVCVDILADINTEGLRDILTNESNSKIFHAG